MASVTVSDALRRGFVWVYGLFIPCIVGIPLLAFIFDLPGLAKLLSVILGFGAAWICWSYQVPRWRIWALRHVENIAELHQQAVIYGIEWPYGSVFERTEIKPMALLYEETLRSLRYYLHQLEPLFDPERDALLYNVYTIRVRRLMPLLETTSMDSQALRMALEDIEQLLGQWYIQLPAEQELVVAPALSATLHFLHRLQRLVRRQLS